MKASKTLKPASYPDTDGSERRAVVLFESAIDLDRVKPDIRTADKVPNTDGTCEITDEKGIPIGVFSVQVRSISAGASKYSCPVELLAYSERCSHPFVLVCVDVQNKRVYWKHIHTLMPEAKSEQGSFTIRFSPNDIISTDSSYLSRWIEIARDYAQRIADYPRLRAEVENKLTVSGLGQRDLAYFQRYIGELNNLFDNDFISVKKLLLADVWKLGIAVTGLSEQAVAFQLFKVQFGSPAPLVCRAEGQVFDPSQRDDYVFSWHWAVRAHMGDAEDAARKLVLDHVEKVVRGRKFSIHGVSLAADVLFAFMRHHSHMLGLTPSKSYSVEDLENGVLNVLPQFCSIFATSVASAAPDRLVVIDFDHLSGLVRSGAIQQTTTAQQRAPWVLLSNFTNLRSVREAIDCLLAERISTIDDQLAQPSNIAYGRSIWSIYTRNEQERNARYLLTQSLSSYAAFVRGNRLRFDTSPYLDADTTIVFEFSPGRGDDATSAPVLAEIHVKNCNMDLPKVVVTVSDSLTDRWTELRERGIRLSGKSYKPQWCSIGAASYLVHRTPLLNSVYRLLAADLRKHYNMSYMACEYP